MRKFNNIIILLPILTVLAVICILPASAQQVGFGLYTDSDLTLTKLVPEDLDFGDRVSGEGTVQILLNDDKAVPVEIEGVAYLDVTVTLVPPDNNYILLQGDADNLTEADKRMPVTIRMAYYNRGQEGITEIAAKAEAIEVVGNTVTFQIRRRPGGPPGPPPVPPHAGYTPPTAKAYLYIYGDLDVGNVNAGPYTGLINVHVEYSTYQ
jgi:hypothetical protein